MIGQMMSIEAYKWAKEQKLSPVQKSVLINIADRWNKAKGYAWPSVARIASDTGWHPRTVSRAIAGLREKGLLAIRRQYFSRDHSLGPNRYYLPLLQNDVPEAGATFWIRGDFDNRGEWEESIEELDP
jgi:hypothetical protein